MTITGSYLQCYWQIMESKDTYMMYDPIFTVHNVCHFNLLYIQADRGFTAASIYQYSYHDNIIGPAAYESVI